MGNTVTGIFKGILVLLALSSWAHAGNTSLELPIKKQIVLVVAVLDDAAFNDADIDSLRRYIKKTLPKHELVLVIEKTSVLYSNIPIVSERIEIRERIKKQILEKVLPEHEITHLIIMDHGNTTLERNPSTSLKFFGTFNEDRVSPVFKNIFDSIVGRFSNNAFVMFEACSAVCDGLPSSEARIKTLMDYFKIENGRVFAAYQGMLSVGYELGFHLSQFLGRIKSPVFIGPALAIGLITQIDVLLSGAQFNILEFLGGTLAVDVALPLVVKALSYVKEKISSLNWGYLYTLKNSVISHIYELNPYNNKEALYLKLEPQDFKIKTVTCSGLFI